MKGCLSKNGTEEKVPALSKWALPMQTLLNVSKRSLLWTWKRPS